MSDVVPALLRGVGLFYGVTALFGLRAVAMERLLSQALAALTLQPAAAGAADRIHTGYLLLSIGTMGAGAIALCALLEIAAGLFVATSALHVAYLAVVAPRFVDPADPPESDSRARSWISTGVYGAAAAFVVAAAWSGVLTPIDRASDVALGGAALATVAFAGVALWWIRPWSRLPSLLADRGGAGARDPFRDDDPDGSEDHPDPATVALVLTPSWGRGAVLDSATGLPIPSEVRAVLLTEEERELLQDWLCLFRDVADPYDPRRSAVKDPADQERLRALGAPIHDRVAARLGPDRVAFEPEARPCGPDETASGVKVMADHLCHPIWIAERDRFGCIEPERFGLSWSLARALDVWALDYDDSIDRDDPGGPPRWSREASATHEREGRELAARLSDELRRTGRAQVAVTYGSGSGEVGPVPVPEDAG